MGVSPMSQNLEFKNTSLEELILLPASKIHQWFYPVLGISGGSNEFTQIHFEAMIGSTFFVCILLRTNGKQTLCHTILSFYFLRWSTPLFLSPTVNSISRCVTFPNCNSNGVYSMDCLQHGVLTHFVNLAISLLLLRHRIHHIIYSPHENLPLTQYFS